MTGILTFHRGPNYGGFLQAWHLQRAIESLGCRAEVVNFQNPVHAESERMRVFGLSPRQLLHTVRFFSKARPFRNCVDDLCKSPFTDDVRSVGWERFDRMIVGSDVVWDFKTEHLGKERAFFGMDPAQKGCRFFAYAVSCGEADGFAEVPDWVSDGIAGFDKLGVRDGNTFELARRFGRNDPVLVVDPTWLQDDPVPARQDLPTRPYVLVYGGALDPKRATLVRDYCRSNDLLLVGASSGHRYVHHVITGIDPFQWANLFRHATAVITATLHGLLYSMKYAKPFLMVRLPPAANKSHTVLEKLGQEHRCVAPQDTIDQDRLASILDPTGELPQIPQDWVVKSRDFLASCVM